MARLLLRVAADQAGAGDGGAAVKLGTSAENGGVAEFGLDFIHRQLQSIARFGFIGGFENRELSSFGI